MHEEDNNNSNMNDDVEDLKVSKQVSVSAPTYCDNKNWKQVLAKLDSDHLGQVLEFHRQIEPVVMGKYTGHKVAGRPQSAISIEEPNYVKIAEARRLVAGNHCIHPMLNYHPDQWKNIPIVLVAAFKDMISSVVTSQETTFEYQVKTNMRMYKVQK